MADARVEDELDLRGVDVEDAPVVKYVNVLIQQAVRDRASDIHLEPGEKDLRVRFRIDGVLHDIANGTLEQYDPETGSFVTLG